MYYRPQTRSVPVLKHQEPEANDYFKTVLLLPEHTAVNLSPSQNASPSSRILYRIRLLPNRQYCSCRVVVVGERNLNI
jgi:hypothetical protein